MALRFLSGLLRGPGLGDETADRHADSERQRRRYEELKCPENDRSDRKMAARDRRNHPPRDPEYDPQRQRDQEHGPAAHDKPDRDPGQHVGREEAPEVDLG